MTPEQLYLRLWFLGIVAGMVVALEVLRRRSCRTPAAVGALLVACVGLFVGARWQQRLEILSVPAALQLGPSELLDAGTRLPLGVLVGGVLAGIWCLVFRVRWRETGDALAIGMMTTAAVGRVACIACGCCPGLPCPPWALGICVTPGPGSLAYGLEVGQGLIRPGAPGVPVLPLAWMFSLTAAAILLVLLRAMRRGARPGSVLLLACILGPIAKVAIEQLRYDPRPGSLQLGIPIATLAVAVTIAVVRWMRERRWGGAWAARISPQSSP